MAVTLCLSCSLMHNRRSRGPLCWVMATFTASYKHLLWTPTHQGPNPFRPGMAFPTTSRLQLAATQLARKLNWHRNSTGTGTQLARRTQLSYIIFRLPLDLWNRMYNRHQTKKKCHAGQRSLSSGASLCSGTVWPSPYPILSALIHPRGLFRLLAIGMCHFLPVHHLGIAFLGWVEGQNTTLV